MTAKDTDEGGELTLWLNGGARPSAEPLYSAGSREEFPIPLAYIKTTYTDLLSSELKNTAQRLVISQSINNGQLTAIFAPHASFKPRPGLGWGTKSNLKDLLGFLQEEKSRGRHVFSLASDDCFGFGVLTIEGYGTHQQIFIDYPSAVNFLRTTDRNFAISAVASWGSRFCFIMTEGVEMYDGEGQTFTIIRSWGSVKEAIEEGWSSGFIITGLCYSKKTGLYVLVMTESPEIQCYRWGLPNESYNDKFVQGYHPTLVLHHPTYVMILTVMTTDQNRSGHTVRVKYPILARCWDNQ